MAFAGRSRELGRLRALLDSRTPALIQVTGIRGGGKTTLVRRAVSDHEALYHACPPLPDPAQRAALDRRISALERTSGLNARPPHGETSGDARTGGGRGGGAPAGGFSGRDGLDASDEPPEWSALFDRLGRVAAGRDRPFVLVLDDAHRLSEARSRYAQGLARALPADPDGPPLHVVLIGRSDGMPDDDALLPLVPDALVVEPLPLRAASSLLPGTRPLDRLVAYGVFGGLPKVLSMLDPGLTTGTNLRRLTMDPDGPLADVGGRWLERDVQTPARYYAVMAALAPRETDWATVRRGVPDVTGSGQLAPYIARLLSLGLITARRSLDAPPRSRSTRYAIADPFLSFWFRAIMPYRVGDRESESDYYARVVRPALAAQMRSVFPLMCRQHMRFDAIETLGVNAREDGSLWGPDYDLPVAGLLTSGGAFYGACGWSFDDRSRSPVAQIESAMRDTRYGFGRERRVRLVFTAQVAPGWLRREVARNRDALIIDSPALLGD